MTSVLVCGLGTMGRPIAQRLRAAGHRVAGHDPLPAALAAWADHGGQAIDATALPAAVHAADVVITCVTDEAALRALWAGEAADGAPLAAHLRAGTLVVDHTTTGLALARALAADMAARGVRWLDAPLSGGVAAAEAGGLLALVGGGDEALHAALPLLTTYCARVQPLGPAGCGQAGKLANQLAIAGTNLGLATAAAFAQAQGLDVAAWLQALAGGSAASAQRDQHAGLLAERPEAGAATLFPWLDKDLRLAQAAASQPLPLAEAVQRLAEAFRPV
ncbi:NAD(P)-dependent oxidoreductase [Aquabacterium sp. J223]|uniref:NAD(P)-dependent oxidoreductase n=1 Tax=Aquabacterium sp. J223 TaxID=2898431 RepID=UPI0021ADAAF9|nr:NAD(P)-binding domain-containing protein [Aquabacterium sp. J223]UUX95412.1 NAD(P)-binding domain-containing protein [Aquabacterium sp. J223]